MDNLNFDLNAILNKTNELEQNKSSVDHEIQNTEDNKTTEDEKETSDIFSKLDELPTPENVLDKSKNISKFINSLNLKSEEDKEIAKIFELSDQAAKDAIKSTNEETRNQKVRESENLLMQGLEKRRTQEIKHEYENYYEEIKNSCEKIKTLKNEINTEKEKGFIKSSNSKSKELWQNARLILNNIITWKYMLDNGIDEYEKDLNDLKARTSERYGFQYNPSDFSDLKNLKLKLFGITFNELKDIVNNPY